MTPDCSRATSQRSPSAARRSPAFERALCAISQVHRAVDLPSPRSHVLVRSALQGVRRTLGVRQDKKRPLTIAALRRLVAPPQRGPARCPRPRPAPRLCFAGAFRRSELVDLDADDICGDGLRRSKADQEGWGREVGIKGYAKQTGLEVDKIAGHSLRAGLVTTAAGKPEHAIMRHTGHASAATVRG